MNRYKLTIEYDGKNFNGWQKQKNMKTVQGIIEESLFKFSGKKITIYGAGRTDTGVHASGQVAHFDIKESGLEDKNSKLGKLTMGVNFYLSRLSDNRVSILETKKVTDEFHSRFSAKGRKYKYSILNRRTSSPLLKDKTWRIPIPLDVQLMKNATKHLIGKHDFTAFRSVDCQANSPVKTIDNITIKKDGELIEIYVEAKSFLMNHVRIIAGTLVDIGLLKKTEEDILTALKTKDKKFSGPTAPASALVLQEVIY